MSTNESASVSERRRHQRVHLQMVMQAIRLDPEEEDVSDHMHMVDVSRGGVGAISDRPYYPGQRILLCLPVSPQSGRRTLYATVRRCRRRDDGYHVGMEFDNTSQDSWYAATATVAMAA